MIIVFKGKILVVEDEFIIAEDIKHMLSDISYEVIGQSATAEEAIMKAKNLNPDLILMDIMLRGEKNGIEAAREIRKLSKVPIIYQTAYAHTNIIKSVVGTEPYIIISKPLNEHKLEEGIRAIRLQIANDISSQ
jgi:DNA-binding NarL/FixJ family response regulator